MQRETGGDGFSFAPRLGAGESPTDAAQEPWDAMSLDCVAKPGAMLRKDSRGHGNVDGTEGPHLAKRMPAEGVQLHLTPIAKERVGGS